MAFAEAAADVAQGGHKTCAAEPSGGAFYQFEFEAFHAAKDKRGRKVFVCDICQGVFKRGFSLKRHYLRFHINLALLSPRDLNNCAIVTSGGFVFYLFVAMFQ